MSSRHYWPGPHSPRPRGPRHGGNDQLLLWIAWAVTLTAIAIGACWAFLAFT